MAISPPNFAKDAIPTLRGWVSKKGELLKSQKISQADINEYLGTSKVEFPVERPAEPVHAPVVSSDPEGTMKKLPSLSKMTKVELEEYAREEFGVELDRRSSKKDLVQQVGQLQAGE
jgi:hypothetical protein